MATSALQGIEQKDTASVRPKTLRKLARAFGMEPLEMMDALGAGRKLLSVRAQVFAALEERAKEEGSLGVTDWLETIAAQHNRSAIVQPASGDASTPDDAPRQRPARRQGRKRQKKFG